jgi:hypothetical protein
MREGSSVFWCNPFGVRLLIAAFAYQYGPPRFKAAINDRTLRPRFPYLAPDPSPLNSPQFAQGMFPIEVMFPRSQVEYFGKQRAVGPPWRRGERTFSTGDANEAISRLS